MTLYTFFAFRTSDRAPLTMDALDLPCDLAALAHGERLSASHLSSCVVQVFDGDRIVGERTAAQAVAS